MKKRTEFEQLPRVSLAGIFLLALGIAACATPDVPPATQIERDSASEQILHEAVYVNTILDNCARLSAPLAEQSDELRQTWQELNGAYLAAADAHFSARSEERRVGTPGGA